jgi:hypothetical protein
MADTRSTIELLFSGNATDAQEAIRRLRESLRGLSRDENDYLRDSQGRFAARSREMRLLGADVDKVSDGLGRFFVSSTRAVGALGAIGNVVPVVAGLASSVTTAAGALLILPAAGIGAAAAITTLKIATAGFGDAVTAADPAAFAKATKDMAPAAVATAVALRDLNPQVKALRQEVQQRFFADFATDARLLGNTYLPVLRPQLAGIATEFNGMGREAARALLAPSAVQELNGVLGATRVQLGDLRPALGNVLTGILAIAGQGANAFGAFGLQITDATTRFRQWAVQAAETGRITDLIRAGKEELSQYGDIAQNVGGILEAVFRGLNTGGLDFTQTLQDSTQALQDFLDSAEGQDTLQALGETLKVTSDVVREVLLVALQELGPVIQEAAPAVQEFARALGSILVDAIRTVGPMLQAFAGFISDNATGIANFLPVLAGLFLGFKALSIINSVVGWARAAGLALGGLALGPVGALLVALGLVAAAIAIFVGGEDDAADAAQRHQDAVDKLSGTLDAYSGAITQATRDQIAHDLSSAKLSDGTTKVTDALRAAGISFADYSAAASGNEGALQKVNAQLLTQAKNVLQNDGAWQSESKTLEKHGISLDKVAAAALGNVEAQGEIAKALESTSVNSEAAKNRAEDLTQRYREAIGPLGELGSTLGGYSGALKDAQEQTKLAGQAALDFGDILKSVSAGLGSLKGGELPLKPMVAGFQDLATAASTSAQAAGQAGLAYGGIKGGANEAAASMEKSRRSFTDAAQAAGLTADQANALADQIGLIPEAAAIAFSTNADQVTGQLIGLNTQIQNVPAGKSVTVSALTDQAIANLRTLGFTVETLPNGQFKVTANDDEARASLAKLIADAQATTGVVQLDANPDLATGKINGTVQLADGSTGTITLDANGNPAAVVLGKTKYNIDQTTGILTIDGNADPADKNRSGMKIAIDRTTGTIVMLANDSAVIAAKNKASQPTFSTHTIRVVVTGDVLGKGNTGLAGGGLIGRPYKGAPPPIFASRGLVLDGYAPGRDSVGPLFLSPGEAVLVPELVKMIGPGNILRANRLASGGRAPNIAGIWPGFAGGGLVAAQSTRSYLTSGTGASSAASSAGVPTAVVVPPPQVAVTVMIDGQEFRGLVRTEISDAERATVRRARTGAGATF